jgi:putative transposase
VSEEQNYVKQSTNNYTGVKLMFEDEAGFGRINEPKYCWCRKGTRPSVPSHRIREYRYAYGAAEPLTGDSLFLVLPYSDTACMNYFLAELSKKYPNDRIIHVCDGASWHRSKSLVIPENIRLFYIPPATPEMNPIEQIWAWIRGHDFRNETFPTLEKVIDRLCEAIRSLSKERIKSITARSWILDCF